MNWKLTAVFAVLCVVLGGFYLSWKPPEQPLKPGTPPRLFSTVPRERVTRLDFRAGAAEVALERQPGVTPGVAWQITRPIKRAASDAIVDDMLTGLFNLTRAAAAKPGDPTYDPARLGLTSPSIVVSVGIDLAKTTIRFGSRSTIDSSLRYFMVDGDPAIYIGLDTAAVPFEKELFEIRNRRLAILDIDRLEKVEVEGRYERGVPVFGPDGKRTGFETKSVYETSAMAKAAEKPGEARPWLLVMADGLPREETLAPDKVVYSAHLVHAIVCENFVDRGDPKAYGLDEPDIRYRFTFKGRPDPVSIAFSCRDVAEGPDRGKRRAVAQVEGADEIAVIKAPDFDRLMRRRNEFRRNVLFDIDPRELLSVKIENDFGSLLLTAETPAGDPPPAPVWSVTAPAMTALPAEELAGIVKSLLRMEIQDFWAMQPDLKLLGLNPPALKVTLGLRRGPDGFEPHTYAFGFPGWGEAYVLRPKSDEICLVAPEVFYQLDRIDLLARSRDVFLVPRADIREVAVEFRSQDLLAPVYYMIRRTASGGWEFANTELKGQEIDEHQLDLLLASISLIQAEAYITRRPERIREYGISGQKPPARLTMQCQSGGASREVVLNISEPFQAAPGGNAIYYAKFEPSAFGEKAGDPFFQMVFRPKEAFVELIKRGVKKRKTAEVEPSPSVSPSESPSPTPTPTPSPTDSSK